jgi:hypothetical protein
LKKTLAAFWFAILASSVSYCALAAVVSHPDFFELRSAVEAGGLVQLKFDGTVMFTTEIKVGNAEIDATGHSVKFDAGGSNRFFKVNGRLVIRSLEFENGSGNDGTNIRDRSGGAIQVSGGTLEAENCRFANNRIYGRYFQWGNFGIAQTAGNGLGGAISAVGSILNLSNCVFFQNGAFGESSGYNQGRFDGASAMGGAIWATDSSVTVKQCQFLQNASMTGRAFEGHYVKPGGGGAIGMDGNRNLIIEHCMFSNNIAAQGNGGAIALGASAKISSTKFISNVSTGASTYVGFGGAIWGTAQLAISESIFVSNRVHGGAGTSSGSGGDGGGVTVGCGGGLSVTGPTTVTNCVFLGNIAVGGDGIWIYRTNKSPFGLGGAVYVSNNVTVLTHVTLASNSVARSLIYPDPDSTPSGSAIYVKPGGTVQMQASVIGEHVPVPISAGPVVDGNYNISIGPTPVFTAVESVNNVDPGLIYPVDGGVPILGLQTSSPAIDRVPVSVTAIDVRGRPRPKVGADSGAIELGASVTAIAALNQGGLEFRLGLSALPMSVFVTSDFMNWQNAGTTQIDAFWEQVHIPPTSQAFGFFKFKTD